VLSPHDDYFVHQTPEPLLHAASGDRNLYDRYFFNGYDREGGLFFGVALGVYPNRSVMDASLSVVRDGVQTSLHASRLVTGRDRTSMQVGPLSVDVEEPMRRYRVRVAENESGLTADLRFAARTPAVEEPRFVHRVGPRTLMDSTRLTQLGAWEGHLGLDAELLELEPGRTPGTRDRSWGVRPVGEREAGAPGPEPQFFWLWAPLHFDDCCTHFDVNEDAEGRRWHQNGNRIALLGPDADPCDPSGIEVMASVDHRVRWLPGTRRGGGATLVLRPHGGEPQEIELEPLLDFPMLGIGYLHPEWGHGVYQGGLRVGSERWKVDELAPLDPRHLHVQQLCRARWGDRRGVGVLEQLVIGRHAPSGFEGLLDGAA